MEIVVGKACRVIVDAGVDMTALSRVLDLLERRIPIAAGARIWIVTGHTDMRKGMQGLALLVQAIDWRNPHIVGGRRAQDKQRNSPVRLQKGRAKSRLL